MRVSTSITALSLLGIASAGGVSTDGRCNSNGRTCLHSGYGDCCSQYNYCGSADAYCGAGCNSGFGHCFEAPAFPSTRCSSVVTGSSTRSSSSTAASSTLKVSTNARCGFTYDASPGGMTCSGSRYGSCCSQYGYCGETSAYCGQGCQIEFGTCDGLPSSVKSSSFITRSTISGTIGRSSTNVNPSSSSISSRPSTVQSSSALPSSSKPLSTNARCGPDFGGRTCLGSKWGDCCSQYSYCGSTSDYCSPQKHCQAEYGSCDNESSSYSSSHAYVTSSSPSRSTPSSSRSSAPSSQSASSLLSRSSSLTSTRSSSHSSTSSSSSGFQSSLAPTRTTSPSTGPSTSLIRTSSNGTLSASRSSTIAVQSNSTTSISIPTSSSDQVIPSSRVSTISSTSNSTTSVLIAPSSSSISASSSVSSTILETSTVASSSSASSSSSTNIASSSSSSSTAGPTCTSILVNGDFETGSLSPWLSYFAAPGSPTFEVISDDTISSEVFHLAAPSGNYIHIRQTVDVPAGSTVTCSFKYRTAGSITLTTFGLYVGGIYCASSLVQSTDYLTVTGTGLTTSAGSEARLDASFGTSGSVAIYADDLSICVTPPGTSSSTSTITQDSTSSSSTAEPTLSSGVLSAPTSAISSSDLTSATSPSTSSASFTDLPSSTGSQSSFTTDAPAQSSSTTEQLFISSSTLGTSLEASSSTSSAVSTTSSAACAPYTLAQNGDFSSGSLSPWYFYNPYSGNTASASITTDEGSSNYFARTQFGPTNYYVYLIQDFSISNFPSQKTWYINAKARVGSGISYASIQVFIGSDECADQTLSAGSTEWQTTSGSCFIYFSDYNTMRFRVTFQLAAGFTTGVIDVDDIYIGTQDPGTGTISC